MLQAGIVGLPNVGKSTLFNAVTRSRKAEAANYPFCTIAGLCLLVFLWVMPFVPGLLRWLVILSLPGIVLWQAGQLVQTGHWFAAAPMLAWWLSLAIVFCMHRTHEKGLFGRRR